MSLRREIHSAFDGIAPPTVGISERVVQTVLIDAQRRRKGKLMVRMRAPLSLVAVFVVIAVVAAVFVGGRILQDWSALHSGSPASMAPSPELAALEARPIHFVSLADCLPGPFDADGGLGRGPIFAYGGSTTATKWGSYFHGVAYSDAATSGPVLVRVSDLATNQPVMFIGRFAAGPVVGTDTVNGKRYEQHTELVLTDADTTESLDPGWNRPVRSHQFMWEFLAGVPQTGSNHTGWQIDGAGFSEVFYAC